MQNETFSVCIIKSTTHQRLLQLYVEGLSAGEIQIVAGSAAPLDKHGQGGSFFVNTVTIASSALHKHTLTHTGDGGRGCHLTTLHLYTHFCWALL